MKTTMLEQIRALKAEVKELELANAILRQERDDALLEYACDTGYRNGQLERAKQRADHHAYREKEAAEHIHKLEEVLHEMRMRHEPLRAGYPDRSHAQRRDEAYYDEERWHGWRR